MDKEMEQYFDMDKKEGKRKEHWKEILRCAEKLRKEMLAPVSAKVASIVPSEFLEKSREEALSLCQLAEDLADFFDKPERHHRISRDIETVMMTMILQNIKNPLKGSEMLKEIAKAMDKVVRMSDMDILMSKLGLFGGGKTPREALREAEPTINGKGIDLLREFNA